MVQVVAAVVVRVAMAVLLVSVVVQPCVRQPRMTQLE
jgi:hypothetical protein